MKTSDTGTSIIQAFESCLRPVSDGSIRAYRCPANVVTIGWGTTAHDFPELTMKTVWPKSRCDEVFYKSLQTRYEPHVRSMLRGAPVTQGQYDALVSWAYNTGGPASSSVWTNVRNGNHTKATEVLLRWNKGGGKVLAGLTRRRKSEVALYKGGEANALKIAGTIKVGSMPQSRETPKPTAPELAFAARKEGTTAAAVATVPTVGAVSDPHPINTALVIGGLALFAVAVIAIVIKIKTEKENWA